MSVKEMFPPTPPEDGNGEKNEKNTFANLFSEMSDAELNACKETMNSVSAPMDIIGRIAPQINRDFSIEDVMEYIHKENALPMKKSFNAIECIPLDHEIFKSMLEESELLPGIIEEGKKILKSFDYLVEDVFFALNRFDPKLVNPDDMYRSTITNYGLIDALTKTPEYYNMRRLCRLDDYNSMYATEAIAQKILDELKKQGGGSQGQNGSQGDDQENERRKLEEAMDDALQESIDLDKMIQEMMERMQQESEEPDPEMMDMLQNMQERRDLRLLDAKLAQEIANRISEAMKGFERNITRKQIGDIIHNTAKISEDLTAEMQELRDQAIAWGMDNNDHTLRVSINEKREALERIRRSPSLRKMTDIIGRFKETAADIQRKKSKHGAVELESVTIGNRIEDILPSERMNLCNRLTKLDFYRRLAENQVLVYKKKNTSALHKGPIVVCVDTSGSMAGEREIWSKAMTVAIIEIAQIQHRDFACIIYSSSADDPIIIEKNETSPDKILDCAERFHNGGTFFEDPLNKAMELMKDSVFKNGDIIFISDGECYLGEEFLKTFKKTKEDKEFMVKGILVDAANGYYASVSDDSMAAFCDSVTRISSMEDLNDAEADANVEIFEGL